MKKLLSLSLILSLMIPYTLPLRASLALQSFLNEESSKILLDNNQNGRRNLNRVNNRNRRRNVNRANNQHDRRNLNQVNNRRGRRDVNRANNRNRRRDNYRNAHRHWRRNIRRDNYRHYSRSRYNNYHTIITQPYYDLSDWWWNNGNRWYPDNYYWGHGFWGNFISSMINIGLTNALINSNYANETPNYVVIEDDSPGYYLFNKYNLTQVECDISQNLVFIYGPQNSLMCAIPNENVPSGYYEVNTESLVLIPIN